MSTEVAVRESPGALAPQRTGAVQGADASDILIPRLYAAQKTSKVVDDAIATFGQLLRSTTNEVLGGLGKAVEFIPLKVWKTSMITTGGKYVRTEPWVPGMNDLPYEFEEDKKTMKRERMLNYFVFLPSDLAASMSARTEFQKTGVMPDKVVSLLPCVIGFKSTSYKAGKTIFSHFAQMEDFGAKPYMRSLKIDTTLEVNDKGKFAVLHVTAGNAIKDKAVLEVCEKWTNILGSTAVKVDEDAEDSVEAEVSNRF